MSLLPVADAQSRLLALAPTIPTEIVPLAQAIGRWSAQDVRALRTQPDHDLSAMDGYAIRFADRTGPMRVIGESAAGRPFSGQVGAGEAVRIFTGAAVPAGADCVLVQEEAARDIDMLLLRGEGPRGVGGNIRSRGLDFARGDIVVAAGTPLSPPNLALAGLSGHGTVTVHRPIRVAIVSTGDELVLPGTPLAAGQLPESNGVMLAALLADLPVDIVSTTILPDRLDTLTDAFRAVDADVLVTTGGASVGDHDLVRPALVAAGATMDFWRIALRPGKPMMAGRMRDTLVLGLPGNPVSAFVTATLFLRPLVAAMAGAADPFPATWSVPLGEPLPANGPRTDYMRGAIVDGRVRVAAIQDSSMLRTLARSTCLVLRAPHAPPANVGEMVEVIPVA